MLGLVLGFVVRDRVVGLELWFGLGSGLGLVLVLGLYLCMCTLGLMNHPDWTNDT